MAGRRVPNRSDTSILVEMLVVFALLISLGFPGQFEKIYGERVGKLLEYAAFAAELVVMLLSSGATWEDIQVLRFDRKYAVLYLYAALIFACSMLTTAFPKEQAITCVRLAVTVFFVIWLQEYYRMDMLLELFSLAQVLFVLAVLYFTVRYPRLAYDTSVSPKALCGLYGTKNVMATELVFGIAMTALLLRQRFRSRRPVLRWVLSVAVQLVLLVMCDATGALLCLAAAFLPLLLPEKLRLPLGLIYITVNVVFLFAMLTIAPLFEDLFDALGKDITLTGRTLIWNKVIEIMQEHKTFLGYGYGMFWRDPKGVELFQNGFSLRKSPFMANLDTGAHNVLMEMWLNVGLVGIAAFFFTLLKSFEKARTMPYDRYLTASVLMFFLMVNSLTERCLGGNYDFRMVAVFLAMALCLNREDAPPEEEAQERTVTAP